MIDLDSPIPPKPPRIPRVPQEEDACPQRRTGLILVLILGAYAWLAILHQELDDHVCTQARAIEERLATLEHETASGMLPETRSELQHLRADFNEMVHRVYLVEETNAKIDAALERIKPLFVPRQVQTR